MKRLLSVLLLMSSYYVHAADTVTSGYVGLLKPQVGVIDTKRSWLDKYNSNMDMLASSMASLNTTVSTSLAATVTMISTTTAQMQPQINFISMSQSTADAKNDAVGRDTATIKTELNGSTNTIRSELNSLHIDTGTFKLEVNGATNTIRSELNSLHTDTGTFKVEVNGSTNTIRSELNALHTDTATIKSELTGSTNTLRSEINSLHTDTGTLKTEVNGATNTIRSELNALHVDTATILTEINSSTGTLTSNLNSTNNFFSTNSSLNDSQNRWLSSATTDIQNRAVPLSLYDEGTSLGNGVITTLNCVGSNITCTQATATGTITISAGASSDTNYKTSTIYLATAGAVAGSADIFDSYGATNAINAAGALGIVAGGSTVTATIMVREGVYKTLNTTIPVQVDFGGVRGSSTVWVYSATDQTMWTVYGRLHDIVIDCSSVAFKGDLVVVKQGGQMENVTYANCSNKASGVNANYLYVTSDYKSGNAGVVPSTLIARVTNVVIPESKPQADFAIGGDGAGFRTVYAQRVEYNNVDFGKPTGSGADSTYSMFSSSWIYFSKCKWRGTEGRNILITGNMGPFGFDSCEFRANGNVDGDSGYITLFSPNNPPSTNREISTGCYITNNQFINEFGNWGTYIKTGSGNGTPRISSLRIEGNVVDSTNYPTSTDGFINLGTAGVTGTIIQNNKTYGISTFLTDSGSGTKNGSGNFKNNIAQGTAQ